MNALVGLAGKTPDIANEFSKGFDAAQGRQMNALAMQGAQEEMGRKQAMFLMDTLAGAGMAALGGDINGQPDPEKWRMALSEAGRMIPGLDVESYINNPGLARLLVDRTISAKDAIARASDDRSFDLALRKFDFDMMDANRRFGLAEQKASAPSAQSPLGKLAADMSAGLISEDEYRAAVSKATQSRDGITVSPDGTISIGGPVDGEYSKKLAAEDAKLIKEARDTAATAQELGAIAKQMETVMPDVGYTGPGGDVYGKVDDVIGVLPGEKGARGAFRQLSMEAQLAMTQKTKGAITDREMGMFRSAVPGLIQTPEGNAAMAKILRATAQRQSNRATFFEQYRAQNGSLDGATDAWERYISENQLIDKTEDGQLVLVPPKKDIRSYLSGERSSPPVEWGIPPGVTEEDVQHTMRLHGMTREQVLELINAR